ncbi:uncharacterized protein [Watersipora subatra]|uniref:uncharacterized protein n=1 Tax=Watersipora subatra TaxID=2589382 RepID=UPI00355AED2B
MNILKQMSSSDDSDVAVKFDIDEKLEQALVEDNVDSSVVMQELKALDDDVLNPSKNTRRVRLARFLESTPLEIFLVALVIIDVIILLIMLLIDLNVLHLYLEDSRHAAEELTRVLSRNCLNKDLELYDGFNLILVKRMLEYAGCTWKPGINNASGTQDLVSNAHSRHKRSPDPAYEGANPSIASLIYTAHILHILSVIILAIMVIEVVLKVFALGLKYFKGKLEVIDGMVIIISFAMDLYFIEGMTSDGASNGATVLVIFLLWRIFRVFNALLVTAKKRLQFRIRVQKRMRKVLEDKLDVVEDDIKNLENHVENLNRLARRHALPDYEVKACKPLVRQSKRITTSAGLASMMHMSMGLMHGMQNMKGLELPRLRDPSSAMTNACADAAGTKQMNNLTSPDLAANMLAASHAVKPTPPLISRSFSSPSHMQQGRSLSNGIALRNWADYSD